MMAIGHLKKTDSFLPEDPRRFHFGSFEDLLEEVMLEGINMEISEYQLKTITDKAKKLGYILSGSARVNSYTLKPDGPNSHNTVPLLVQWDFSSANDFFTACKKMLDEVGRRTVNASKTDVLEGIDIRSVNRMASNFGLGWGFYNEKYVVLRNQRIFMGSTDMFAASFDSFSELCSFFMGRESYAKEMTLVRCDFNQCEHSVEPQSGGDVIIYIHKDDKCIYESKPDKKYSNSTYPKIVKWFDDNGLFNGSDDPVVDNALRVLWEKHGVPEIHRF